ncbi:hypothetical protein F5B18DRAFT_661781 [Nemania serpens]|nr:hypothetical protein F5B18DRAFT_661781 [Nemania serpens]
MLDFCIALQPHDTTAAERIRELRRRTSGSTTNHTDFYPLRDKPIILTVESKKPGEGLLEAQTQVGVWQAAQWRLLEMQHRGTQHSGESGTAGLPFLPALFIQGAQWSFAATTRHGNETLLWTQQNIGATDTVLGIFQIIHTLRHLAQWSTMIYWKWYKIAILAINET